MKQHLHQTPFKYELRAYTYRKPLSFRVFIRMTSRYQLSERLKKTRIDIKHLGNQSTYDLFTVQSVKNGRPFLTYVS